jgi:hypothetical protein
MNEPENTLEDAIIKWDGSIRGPEDEPIVLFMVETNAERFWFEVFYQFAENGNDFSVAIGNFGLRDKSFAGSKGGVGRKSFNLLEEQSAKNSIKALLMGPKDNTFLPFAPFRMEKARCLEVIFPDGWITLK